MGLGVVKIQCGHGAHLGTGADFANVLKESAREYGQESAGGNASR
ncbi:hypothetical protein FRUB_09599 [Fimbriiglobus ruber]|uniref:Uncharacterized protein n=1 Tax=Fimbriiglobus ruber TaxID=1908690 RepID=A0A225DF86_9BACT|nr:hypothetical protein FRUB_09599 [Fimbriiglobus ruber]